MRMIYVNIYKDREERNTERERETHTHTHRQWEKKERERERERKTHTHTHTIQHRYRGSKTRISAIYNLCRATHACAHTHRHTEAYAHIPTYTYTQHTHTHTHTHACIYFCMYACVYMYVCMYVTHFAYTFKNFLKLSITLLRLRIGVQPLPQKRRYPRYDTKLHLMVRFYFLRTKKCGVPLHCNFLRSTLTRSSSMSSLLQNSSNELSTLASDSAKMLTNKIW